MGAPGGHTSEVAMRAWSPKQLDAVHLRFLPNRYIYLHGGTGSGKTSGGVYGFILYSLQFRGRVFGLIAKTHAQVEDVLFANVERACEELLIPYHYISRTKLQVGPNVFRAFSGNDIKQKSRIQGVDVAGMFIDEAMNMPRELMEMINTRVGRQADGGKVVMTGNPEGTLFWFQREWIDRAAERDMALIHLTPYDNPSLPEDFIRSLEAERGHIRDRFLLGIPSDPTGLVYADYDICDLPPVGESLGWYIAVDPADASRTHALLVGRFGRVYIVYDEYVHDYDESGYVSHKAQAAAIAEMAWSRGLVLSGAVCDSNNQSFRRELQRRLGMPVANAHKNRALGIRNTQEYLSSRLLKIGLPCAELRAEMSKLRWDENKRKVGVDDAEKKADHGCDALRYFVMSRRDTGDFNVRGAKQSESTWF